jgi:hypothetical protein
MSGRFTAHRKQFIDTSTSYCLYLLHMLNSAVYINSGKLTFLFLRGLLLIICHKNCGRLCPCVCTVDYVQL